jgi:hypothetical protein
MTAVPAENACWTGNKWVDWEHSVVLAHALRKVWPANVVTALDVGAGDGTWTEWMADEFTCYFDAIDPYPRAEWIDDWPAEDVYAYVRGNPRGKYDLITVINSLGYFADWPQAVYELRACDVPVLVADNTQQPTPSWYQTKTGPLPAGQGVQYRQHIEYDEQIGEFEAAGFRVVKAIGQDVIYRKWLDSTPSVLHPVVAYWSAFVDQTMQGWVDPADARHSVVLFE